MRLVAPHYYKDFKCTASACKHSCCIGWEIDIDPETLEIYNSIEGDWGERFKKSISFEGDLPHFVTRKDGRCTFLNQKGLCDIITAFGEDGLCQICYDHPRFRNFYSDRTEIGLGLCCEAAAELILKSEKRVAFTTLYEEDETPNLTSKENESFSHRDEILNIFQNRELPLNERIIRVADIYKINPFSENISKISQKHRSLERLDPKWDDFLNKTEEENFNFDHILNVANKKIPLPTEQLLCYFLYRYFATEDLQGKGKTALNFVITSTLFCLGVTLSYYGQLVVENLCEVCRMFSCEVEYSEENVDALLKGGK